MWHVPDELWRRIEAMIESQESGKPKLSRGRPRVDRRRILDGIIFRLRTRCRWNLIPPVYGNDSTLHRYFRLWSQSGVLESIWRVLVEHSPEMADLWTPPPSGTGKEGELEGRAGGS
jgi:putative transposase